MGRREARSAGRASGVHALALTRRWHRGQASVGSLLHASMEAIAESAGLPRRAFWRALSVLCLFMLPGQAETPIDPVRLVGSTDGRLLWQAALGYSASGLEGFGIDESGSAYAYVLLTQNWTLSASAAIDLSSTMGVGASLTLQREDTAERRQYANQETNTSSSGRSMACRVWQQFRLDAANEFDPRLTIAAGYPASGGFLISGSLLRDPVILTAQVGLQGSQTLPAVWLTLSLGVGFIANSRIQITGFMGADIPTDAAGLPTSSMGFEVRYKTDSAGRATAVRASLVLRGERPSLVAEVELSG